MSVCPITARQVESVPLNSSIVSNHIVSLLCCRLYWCWRVTWTTVWQCLELRRKRTSQHASSESAPLSSPASSSKQHTRSYWTTCV